VEIRPKRANLFMGKKEEKKKGQRNMLKLKVIYRNFGKALARNK